MNARGAAGRALVGVAALVLLAGCAPGAGWTVTLATPAPAAQVPATPFACPPGSTPDKPGPVDQARPLGLAPTGAALAFDRRAGRLVAVTGTTDGPATETWTFDVCTNTWTRMPPNREPPRFGWARLVYDVDSDATLLVSSGGVWAYDLQANTWTEKGVVSDAWLWAYDPLSGLVVAQGGLDPAAPLSTYDVETDTWTPIQEVGAPETGAVSGGGWPVYGVLAYDASVDRIVAVAGVETWLFDIRTHGWSRSHAVPPHVLDWWTLPAIAYDETAKRTVIGGNVRMAAYDATTDRWEPVEFPGPDAWHGVSIVYDPVNERLVVLPDSWESWEGGANAGVVAYDLSTREWTVLLEAGKPITP
jgi:hypothetical protein